MRTAPFAVLVTISRPKILTAGRVTAAPPDSMFRAASSRRFSTHCRLGRGRRFLNRGGIVDQALGGWQFSTITTVQDGTSITTRSWDSAGQTIVPDGNRLNCIAGVSQVASSPNPDLYYVPAAFANTTAGQFGNCGRNNLIAPSQWNVDFSLLKDFRLAERHSLQFRMEMFNAPNHPAWGRPSANWGNQNAVASTSFGRIRSTIQLRQIQFALKYYF